MNPYTRPDWMPRPHPPPRRRPAWLIPVVVCAVTAVVTGGSAAGMAILVSGDGKPIAATTPSTSRNVRNAPPTPLPTGTFVRVQRPCEFISQQTAGTLVPEAQFQLSEPADPRAQDKAVTSSCDWNNIFSYEGKDLIQRHRRLKVWLHLFKGSRAVGDAARLQGVTRLDFRKRAGTRLRNKGGTVGALFIYGPYVHVPGMGDEASLQYIEYRDDDPDFPAHSGEVKLSVRYENVVLEVEYSGSDTTTNNVKKKTPEPLDQAAVRRGAEAVAAEVIKRLAACTACRA